MAFDKYAHIKRMKPHADKLVAHFKNKGVEFSDNDGEFENVTFTSKERKIKISHWSFYRFSGIACITKEGSEKNSSVTIEVTDEMFMQMFMTTIVEALLKGKGK